MKPRKIIQLLISFTISFLSINKTMGQTWNPGHAIGSLDGNYNFSYNQTPSQLVELSAAAIPNTGLSYQWQSNPTPIFPPSPTVVGTQSGYTFSGSLTQTTYYRRKTTYTANGSFIYSNVIKISVVSVNWEDINYIREHDVLTTGITTW